jgi:tetratricopeptide (TPR) repeat protein
VKIVTLMLLALACDPRAAWAGGAQGAKKAEARRQFERGNLLYAQGRYDLAIEALKAGYALDDRPDFLYALGQAERRRGDCAAALSYYQAYLETAPSAPRAEATLLLMQRCNGPVAPAAPVVPAPAARPPVEAPAPAAKPSVEVPRAAREAGPATAAARAKPVYKRWWLWTTLVGVVAVGVGVGVGVALWQRSSFDSTLPDLQVGHSAAALGVRF